MDIIVFVKLFIFIFSIMTVTTDVLYALSVFILKSGKVFQTKSELVCFGLALSYIITYLIA